ncbi:MAG: zinc ribbon domain-containing protein, partial [Desulfobacterales bacterium]
MKHKLFTLIFLIILIARTPGFAQSPAAFIDSLDIEIWPDYDKPSVLVLLTGTLPGDTPLPATVSLPLPEAAQLNAVARIDGNDGNMIDDILWSTDSPNTLTFSTPDLRFRVEYYLPYTVKENQRSFDYTWLAAIGVNNFQLRVQRPISASTLNTEPAAANVAKSWDGFDYHTFPARAVPAGQLFSLHVDYQMAGAQLSVANMPRPNTGVQAPASPAAPSTGSDRNWALAAMVAGGLIVCGALIWQIASRRRSPDIREPNDSRVEKRSGARFCSNCGEPVDEDDRFCRGCG